MSQRIAQGSKSERVAAVLVTGEHRYVLRVKGGHPLRDPRLEALVGREIAAEGDLHGQYFDMSNWVVEGDLTSEGEA